MSTHVWLTAVCVSFFGCQVVTGLDELKIVDAGTGTMSSPVRGAPNPRDAEVEPQPADPCPTIEDGRCDEAKGTGECAEGTDPRDCSCEPKLPDASCDVVAQCGCPKGETCAAIASSESGYTAECRAWTGARRQNEPCDASEECAPGHLCEFGGLCTRVCDDDAQCPNGRCLRLSPREGAASGLKTCHWTCDRARSACGPNTCARFDERFEVQGDFCVVPLRACFQDDGVCDEPRGSGLCAEGADVVDCCEPSLPGGECDLVLQCGCETKPGTSCQLMRLPGGAQITSCVAAGETPANHTCLTHADCERGTGCVGNVCRTYCERDADCSGGRCAFNMRGAVTTPVKTCLGPCDPSTNEPCGPGTRCMPGSIDDRPATGCTFVPLTATCPTDNGRCDEPGGTGLCAPGSDPIDCG